MITRENNSFSFTVTKNSVFTIALEANRSTGYSWNLVSIDSTRVRPAGQPRFTARDSLPGTSGTCFLDFRALEKGKTRIGLAYYRNWEKEFVPQDSFYVTIYVK